MPGKIKKMAEEIIKQRSLGNETLATTTRIKLMLKGVNSDAYNESSPDDLDVIKQLISIAKEMGLNIDDMNL